MSLKPSLIEPVPDLTARTAHAAFPKGNPYLTLRDELGTLSDDEDFAARFPRRGQAGLGRLGKQDAAGRAELLKQAIFNRPTLYELAQRPLLLALMVSLHAWRGGDLPEKREALYADTVDLLLNRWEQRLIKRDAQGQYQLLQPSLAEYLKVDKAKVRTVLEELAFAAHRSQPDLTGTTDLPEKDLAYALFKLRSNPEANIGRLVEYLRDRAGLLHPRGVGIYTFPHRSFQEYLAACHLTDEDYPEQIAELVRSDPDRWREVALLAFALAELYKAKTPEGRLTWAAYKGFNRVQGAIAKRAEDTFNMLDADAQAALSHIFRELVGNRYTVTHRAMRDVAALQGHCRQPLAHPRMGMIQAFMPPSLPVFSAELQANHGTPR